MDDLFSTHRPVELGTSAFPVPDVPLNSDVTAAKLLGQAVRDSLIENNMTGLYVTSMNSIVGDTRLIGARVSESIIKKSWTGRDLEPKEVTVFEVGMTWVTRLPKEQQQPLLVFSAGLNENDPLRKMIHQKFKDSAIEAGLMVFVPNKRTISDPVTEMDTFYALKDFSFSEE